MNNSPVHGSRTGVRSVNSQQPIPLEIDVSLSHPTTPRRSHSERLSQHQPLSSGQAGHEHGLAVPRPSRTLSSESAGNQESTATNIERKRRLTQTSEVGRRRVTTGGFTARDNNYYEPRSSTSSNRLSGAPTAGMAEREVIDLTSSSPQTPAATFHHQHDSSPTSRTSLQPQARTASNSSRGYQAPRWQPDHEVNECPICHRQFGFLFRRHHCRKCGRVVCNDCSPHRITIPRQYIVHPPGLIDPIPTMLAIDLTQGDDDEGGLPVRRPNPALGGGQKVRLCNPCVPDPQPDLHHILREGPPDQSYLSPRSSHEHGTTPFPNFVNQRPGQTGHDPSQTQAQTPRYYNQLPPHPGTRLSLGSNPDNDSDSSTDGYPGLLRQHMAPTQSLAGNRFPFAHSRYHSLDSRQAPLPPLPPLRPHSSRPRHSSMFDPMRPQYGARYGAQPGMHPGSSVPVQPRPPRRIREEDLCPICRGMLPPKGADGDETDRESHIMECINNSTSTSRPRHEAPIHAMSTSMPSSVRYGNSGLTMPVSAASSSTTPPQRTLPTQMLRFTATEKDCTAQTSSEGPLDTSTTECSICMVEYEVGDRLVRLECWCKFHEECIVEWFGRKAECPVHKLS